MTVDAYEPPTRDDLEEDLRWATGGPVHRYYKKPEHFRKCPDLASLVDYLQPEKWRDDPNYALNTTLRKGLLLRFPEGGPPQGPKGGGLSWKEIGELLCGFKHQTVPRKENGQEPAYDEYLDEARRRAGYEKVGETDGFKAHARLFRKHLADALLQLTPGDFLQVTEAEPDHQILDGRRFISRPDVTGKFQQLRLVGARTIALVGQAGMGKTWLARVLTMSPDGREAPRIRMVDGQLSEDDLAAALLRCDIEVPTRVTGQSFVTECIRKLLVGDKAPEYVIFDNLNELGEIGRLLPPNPNSFVVLTSRTEGGGSQSGFHILPVESFTAEQSAQLVAVLAPGLSPDHVAHLGAFFHGHPLALSYACRIVKEHKRSVRDFCDEVADDRETLAESVHTEEGRTLYAVLQILLDMLAVENAQARILLDVSCFLERRPWIHRDFLERYLSVHSGTAISRASFTHALEALRRYALVDFQDESRLTVHPMTQEILRALLIQNLPDVSLVAHGVMVAYSEHVDEKFDGKWIRQPKGFRDSLFSALIHTADIYGEVLELWNRSEKVEQLLLLELEERGFFSWVKACIPEREPGSQFAWVDSFMPDWKRFDAVSERAFPLLPEERKTGVSFLMFRAFGTSVQRVANGGNYLRP